MYQYLEAVAWHVVLRASKCNQNWQLGKEPEQYTPGIFANLRKQNKAMKEVTALAEMKETMGGNTRRTISLVFMKSCGD